MALGLAVGDRRPSSILALLAALGLAADLRLGGLRLPGPRRQVDERWLHRYRGWVYGVGFGFQLGFGLLTVVTTSTVYLTRRPRASPTASRRGLGSVRCSGRRGPRRSWPPARSARRQAWSRSTVALRRREPLAAAARRAARPRCVLVATVVLAVT